MKLLTQHLVNRICFGGGATTVFMTLSKWLPRSRPIGFPRMTELIVIFVPGSAITGPVAKECADCWPRIASNASSIA